MFDLTFEEQRVLGCLLEKEMATPEYYPLTLNALVAACNQRTSREPVVDFDSALVERVLGQLRDKGLGILVREAGARVPKFKHRLNDRFPDLSRAHRALLCVLLLRGRQTAGELRSRCDRLFTFADLPAVDEALDYLISYEPSPLVRELPPGGGRQARSYLHLLGIHHTESADAAGIPPGADNGWGSDAERIRGSGSGTESRESPIAVGPPTPTLPDPHSRVVALEERVATLERELASLRDLVLGDDRADTDRG